MSAQQTSEKKNKSFFLEHHDDYRTKISGMKTYANIYNELSETIKDTAVLIDVGNGGVFDYDPNSAEKIVAVDLMFTPDFRGAIPPNCETRLGSALDLPLEGGVADVVLMNMLLHHLTGRDVSATRDNVARAFSEAFRILRPGGRLVVMESCVPPWFYAFEKVVYKMSSKIIEKILVHPPTLQFPPAVIKSLIDQTFENTKVKLIPKGPWILQFGKKWPSALTPAQPYLFTAKRP